MIRAFRYPLRLTKAQETIFDGWLVATCDLYNGALQHRRDAWRKQHVSVSCYEQMRDLAKSTYDAAWGVFLRALASKAESAGKHCIAVDPRGTSRTCPACGTVEPKTLKQREHRCACGFMADRDHAAAQIILGRGLRLVQLTEASREVGPAFLSISGGA